MAVVRTYIGLDGRSTTFNPFPKAQTGSVLPMANTKNTYAKGTKEHIAFRANFESGSGLGGSFARQRDADTLRKMASQPVVQPAAAQSAPAPVTTAPKQEAERNIGGPGANKSSARRGSRRTMGVASEAFAGNVGSVNTEVQNDDALFPYMKGNI